MAKLRINIAIVIVIALLGTPGKAVSTVTDGAIWGEKIGELIGYAHACNINIDANRLQDFVSKNVNPRDPEFSHWFDLKSRMTFRDFEDKPDLDRKIICFQTGRVLKEMEVLP